MKNICGNAIDTITLYSVRDIFVPNIVTHNGDTLNDDFRAVLINENEEPDLDRPIQGHFMVFNRWGKPIFSDTKYINGWPKMATDLESGIYYFTFDYGICPAIKGWIHLVETEN